MAQGFNREVLLLPSSFRPTAAHFALDIGGSLAKLAFIPRGPKRDDCKGIELHLVTFHTDSLDSYLTFIRDHVIGETNHIHRYIRATGVGAMKHKDKIANYLSVELQVDTNEMQHAARGVDILWRVLPPDKLLYEGSDAKGCQYFGPLTDSGVLPCLLVILGSALTIIEIGADGVASGVVGGSSQGGLTFCGLGALLTSAKSFDSLLDLSERGDRRSVDLLVKDTAGTEYNADSEAMVSSFGKAAKLRTSDPNSEFREEDIASSLLYCITDQMAQTTYFAAKAQGISSALICGSYLAGNQTILQQIKTKLTTCSKYLKHEVSSLFLRHEGYLGAIGLLLGDCPIHANNNS